METEPEAREFEKTREMPREMPRVASAMLIVINLWVMDNTKYKNVMQMYNKTNIILWKISIYTALDVNYLHLTKACHEHSSHILHVILSTSHLHGAKLLLDMWCPYMRECEWQFIVSKYEIAEFIRSWYMINEYQAFWINFLHVWGTDFMKELPRVNIINEVVKDMGWKSFDKCRLRDDVYKN